jgi:hypothetical protein
MTACPGSASVMSMSMGYTERCGISLEHIRNGCTHTPRSVQWAGDIVILKDSVLKQSRVEKIKGEGCNLAHTFSAASEECGEKTASPDNVKEIEEEIRDGSEESFEFTIPQNANRDNEKNWDLDVLMSNDECGEMQDGGDVLIQKDLYPRVVSLCGTIDRTLFNPTAHYLDNRKSYSDDPDNGLLVAIRNGLNGVWEVRYSPVERILTEGLVMSDDVTVRLPRRCLHWA